LLSSTCHCIGWLQDCDVCSGLQRRYAKDNVLLEKSRNWHVRHKRLRAEHSSQRRGAAWQSTKGLAADGGSGSLLDLCTLPESASDVRCDDRYSCSCSRACYHAYAVLLDTLEQHTVPRSMFNPMDRFQTRMLWLVLARVVPVPSDIVFEGLKGAKARQNVCK
jgi:hypothetical protein